MAKEGKRKITGYKTFSKAMKFTGKYGLKGLAKTAELGVRGGSKLIEKLSSSEQFQVIATTGGLIAATVACPAIGLGAAGIVGAKFLADKILGKKRDDGKKKNILDSMKETLLLGNKVTKTVCNRIISPVMSKTNEKAKSIGRNAQTKIDELFDR